MVFFFSTTSAQISIINTLPVIENFDAMAASATASLPTNWKISSAGSVAPTWLSSGNFTNVTQQASTGTPTAGGRYNWGTSATERALGIMTSGSYASPNSIMAFYQNNNASAITDLTIAYDLERYRINTSIASVEFYYSLDGSNWVAVNAGDITSASIPTGASSYSFAPQLTINKTAITITGLSIANSSNFYLRWNLNTTGSSSQGIGIDNVSVTAGFGLPTPQIFATPQNITPLNYVVGNGPSAVQTFTVSGSTLSTDILILAPLNFEISTNSTTGFVSSLTLTQTAGSVANTIIYIRLVSGLSVGNYADVIELNSAGATTIFINASGSVISAVVNYNYYFGNIHAHTAYSDGNQENNILYDCPAESYDYAKTSQNFDFLGISEHNHSGAGMSLPRYADGLQEASLATINGTFVALYGMEWGVISQGGHVLVYGYDQLIGWEAGNYDVFNAIDNYNDLFKKIARYPTGKAFAYFAHPENTDYDSLFFKNYNATNDSAIVGCAIRSGPAFSTNTTYTNPSNFSYEIRYKEALSRGYHLGAGLDHDNHYTTFGRTAQSRLVILATELSQNSVLDAVKSMRMYASDDWNLKVNYTINGQVLGSIFSNSGNPTISVSVTDNDAETVSSIAVFYGVPSSGVLATQLTANTNSSTLNYTHSIANGETYYYYIVITQPDGNKVFTSPIWYTRNDAILPIVLNNFNAQQNNNNVIINWQVEEAKNTDYVTLESSLNGFDFLPIESFKVKTKSNKKYEYTDSITPKKISDGFIYYRLKSTDFNGELNYSELISVHYKAINLVEDLVLFPNPATNVLNLYFFSKESSQITLIVSDVLANKIYEKEFSINTGKNNLTIDLLNFKNGIYHLNGFDSKKLMLLSKSFIINK
ncbi:MAG: T9SS type A sorting domain-containing protein [Bacteroidota bacterium]